MEEGRDSVSQTLEEEPERISGQELVNPIARLTRDLRNASSLLTHREARYLVDLYYMIQGNRIAAGNQKRAMIEIGEPYLLLDWIISQSRTLERQLIYAFSRYVEAHPFGEWTWSVVGIGPVLSAGLIAHIDIEKILYPGQLWSFAGLVPSRKWNKGEKRPWNASLKTLCAYKIGESFVKVQNKPDDVYGKVYAKVKRKETERNEQGGFEEEAARILQEKTFRKTTTAYQAYSKGKLPLGHLHARARRAAVKLFLAHLQQVWYFIHYKKPAPVPFAIKYLGHDELIYPPNLHLVPGFEYKEEQAA